MKTLILTGLWLLTFQSWGYSCPANLATQRDARALHEWLAKFQGRFAMRGCRLEITACNPAESGGDRLLGEIYIMDAKNREAYLPVILVASDNPQMQTHVAVATRRAQYMKVDNFYEDQFGRQETYRLDMRTDPAGTSLTRLDLGTYSTNQALHQPNGNQSRWWNCGESAEGLEFAVGLEASGGTLWGRSVIAGPLDSSLQAADSRKSHSIARKRSH